MNGSAVNQLLAQLNPEVWLVTARAGSRRGGLIATAVSTATIVPEQPRMLVALSYRQYTRELVDAGGAFALHLLGEEHLDLVWRFALASGRDVDKLAGLTFHEGKSGSPLLTETLGWLDCRVEACFDTGDRKLFLAEVLEGCRVHDRPALTEQRLLQLAAPEQKQQLKQLRQQAIPLEADAICAWRQARRS